MSAQERTISEQEISALRKNASEKLKSKIYRVKMIYESWNINSSAPDRLINITTEYLPDRYHNIIEIKTVDGTSHEEAIKIGKRKFVKWNNEAWKELSPAKANDEGDLISLPVAIEVTVECKYLGKRVINNQNADLYEIKTTKKYKFYERVFIPIYTERFWFNQDGLFLKTESETELNNKTSHTIDEYEYDPKDQKIEAPIK